MPCPLLFLRWPRVAALSFLRIGQQGFLSSARPRALLTVRGEHRACPEATVAPEGTATWGGMLRHYHCRLSFLSRAPLAFSKGCSGCGAIVIHLHLARQLPSNLRETERLPEAPGPHVGGRPCCASKHASLPRGSAGLRHFCNLGGLIFSPCFTSACLLLSGPKRTGTGLPPRHTSPHERFPSSAFGAPASWCCLWDECGAEHICFYCSSSPITG